MNSTKMPDGKYLLTVINRGEGGDETLHHEYYSKEIPVKFTVTPKPGSAFKCWRGDAKGTNSTCNLTMDSDKYVIAESLKLHTTKTDIAAEITSTGLNRIGDKWVTSFGLTLRNHDEQQVRIKVGLTSYLSQDGQTHEQSRWASDLVNGSKGVTLAAGAFCKMGLVYFMRDQEGGDCLHVTVERTDPPSKMHFTFTCGSGNAFFLTNATQDDLDKTVVTKATQPTMVSALKRIALLEDGLSEVSRKLDAMQHDFFKLEGKSRPGSTQTLSEVFAWLAMQDQVGTAELRARLLPLNVLTGALVNEINELALDIAGEMALEELGNEIVVTRKTLGQILGTLDIEQFERRVSS